MIASTDQRLQEYLDRAANPDELPDKPVVL
jgi:hypothetical protein